MGDRTILHCDCNSFFASVETVLCPELANGPMAVCGDPNSRHGIILAKNDQAKVFGIQTAETIWSAKRKCPELRLVSPHRDAYVEYSRRCNEIYLQYTDLVDPFGCDESFLDVTGSLHLFGSGEQIANELRQRMLNELGLTISVGVSFNRAFAKLGSDYKKPNATTVFSRENYRELVWPMPVNALLFVGRRAGDQLARRGIHTIGELAASAPVMLKSLLGKQGETLWQYARGEDAERVHSFYEERAVKSIGNSMTFSHDLLGEEEQRFGLTLLCDTVGRRLRKHQMQCQTVQLIVRDPEFRNRSRQVTLPVATDSTRVLLQTVLDILHANWAPEKPVRLLSVTGMNLTIAGEQAEQLSLFDDAEALQKRKKLHSLDQTVDQLRSRFGEDAVTFAHAMQAKSEREQSLTASMPHAKDVRRE